MLHFKKKYVVGEYGSCAVFDLGTQHKWVHLRSDIVGAGFCHVTINNGKFEVSCFGESISLGIKSRGEEDAIVLERFFNE